MFFEEGLRSFQINISSKVWETDGALNLYLHVVALHVSVTMSWPAKSAELLNKYWSELLSVSLAKFPTILISIIFSFALNFHILVLRAINIPFWTLLLALADFCLEDEKILDIASIMTEKLAPVIFGFPNKTAFKLRQCSLFLLQKKCQSLPSIVMKFFWVKRVTAALFSLIAASMANYDRR